MKALEVWTIAYLLNSIWQVPLVFAAAWIAARLARPIGPRVEHRVWVGALIVQTLLPACQFDLNNLWQQAEAFFARSFHGPAADGHIYTLLGPASASASGLSLPPWLSAAIAIAYSVTALYFIARLAWGIRKTALMQQHAQPFELTADLQYKFNKYRRSFGL
jgi:hypothetical protein